MGFTKPNESPRSLVRSYRTVSPLPRTTDACLSKHPQSFGGLFSVALSLASRPVDVIDHPTLRSPDFPPIIEPASKLDDQRSPHPLVAVGKDGHCNSITQPPQSQLHTNLLQPNQMSPIRTAPFGRYYQLLIVYNLAASGACTPGPRSQPLSPFAPRKSAPSRSERRH